MRTYNSFSAEDTQRIASEFAGGLKIGDVIALSGGLGAGKTAFVRGMAEALHCAGEVSSPTFTLVNEYLGEIPLYHFDVYRLKNLTEYDSGWIDEYLFGDGICVIEWAENIAAILPADYIHVKIEKDSSKGEDYREITIC